MTEARLHYDSILQAIEAIGSDDYLRALTLLSDVYGSGGAEPPLGLSYYGLALALVDHDYPSAIDACSRAIDLEPKRAEHCYNLARVYRAAGMHGRCWSTLERALVLFPDDTRLRMLREEIGVRLRPAIPFLSRGNALNRMIGRMRYERQMRKKLAETEQTSEEP